MTHSQGQRREGDSRAGAAPLAGLTDFGRPIHFGVAGWSYEDWRDTVYRLPPPTQQPMLFADLPVPPPAHPRHAADPLRFLSAYVDMVEVNSSFYRIPSVRSTHSWAEKVADRTGFFFTAKLHQDFTHRFSRESDQMRTFVEAFRPLRRAGLLRGILAQFRYDFDDCDDHRAHLDWICSHLADHVPVILEVRHRSWQHGYAPVFLRQLGVTVANLDYPRARNSFHVDMCLAGDDAYLRLHGRNRDAWFRSDLPAHETYNYDYDDGEVSELADRATHLLKGVKTLTIVANNHYRGKAVSAALRLKSELLKQKVAVPPALLETYPALKRIADVDANP